MGGVLLAGVLVADVGIGQEARTLRYGFQAGEVYHYDVEFGMTFEAGETQNRETIRGVESLIVLDRDDDSITILPVASGLRVVELSIHGTDLEAYAESHREWTEPFFGTGVSIEPLPDLPPHVFLGKLVARIRDTGHAPVEEMVPRFWSLLIPIGEWLQNHVTAAAYPWPVLPADAVVAGEEWDFTIPGGSDTFHFSYAGPEAGDVPCDLVHGALDVSPEISASWGATEGIEIRTSLCLAREGQYPVREELRASQRLGDGDDEQWIRTVLIGRHRLDGQAIEIVRLAADTAFPAIGQPDPHALESLVGSPAPPLALERADGSATTLADFRGRVAVVHFWAPWASQSSQTLSALLAPGAGVERESVAIMPVVVEDEASRLLGLARVVLAGIDSTAVAYRPAAADLSAYRANEILPVTILIDGDGVVRRAFIGAVGARELREGIEALHVAP